MMRNILHVCVLRDIYTYVYTLYIYNTKQNAYYYFFTLGQYLTSYFEKWTLKSNNYFVTGGGHGQ